jgi:hypothetical protein
MTEAQIPGGQHEPIEDGHDDASDGDKLAGIVEQTKQDAAAGNVTDLEDALRQRLADAGIDLDEQEFASLLGDTRA